MLLSCVAPLPLALGGGGGRRERFIARLRFSYTMVWNIYSHKAIFIRPATAAPANCKYLATHTCTQEYMQARAYTDFQSILQTISNIRHFKSIVLQQKLSYRREEATDCQAAEISIASWTCATWCGTLIVRTPCRECPICILELSLAH